MGNDKKYTPTIGLEIHAELSTQSKLFCGCKNDASEEEPNVNICPICMAYPGTLPLLNKEAVRKIIQIGRALKGTIPKNTHFDRKNYFYPDIPKGYQISQYDEPLVEGGELNGVQITRVHLEEDTARSNHELVHGSTLIDFNRAGVPLMELVTEPVIKNEEEASAFAKELQRLLKMIPVSNARMEKGEMRVEANISISLDATLGTKVEVKNLNSFKSVERAIRYEIKRQKNILEKGGEVIQETRGWDENEESTFSQRIKENASDYRYFPDPDIPPLRPYEDKDLNPIDIQSVETPNEIRIRYKTTYDFDEGLTTLLMDMPELHTLFINTMKLGESKERAKLIANYLTGDITAQYKKGEKLALNEMALFEISEMLLNGEISSHGAKKILAHLTVKGGAPRLYAEKHSLLQDSNEKSMKDLAQEIIKEYPDAVKEYKKGKEESIQFLIGQGMKKSKGQANPSVLKKALTELLA